MDDPGAANIIAKIVFLLMLVLANALVIAGRVAITTFNDSKLRDLADDNDPKAKRIIKLTEKTDRFLGSTRLATTFFCILTAVFAAAFFCADIYTPLIHILPAGQSRSIRLLVVFLMAVVVTLVYMILGVRVPKKIGAVAHRKVAYGLIGFISFVTGFFSPFYSFNRIIANGLLYLFGTDPNADTEIVTEEEIRMMVDAGEEKGVIEESQKEMINNIFEFDDIVAADVMTHRTDMVAVDLDESFDDVVKLAIDEGCSRIPAYKDDIDDVRGIIYVKDLLRYVGHELPKNGLESIMRTAHFVPESKRCGDLFAEMTEKHIQMCIVSDEYGGTAGLVTIEDLLESIVGNIQDEYDKGEEQEIKQINDTTYTVDGTTDIDEVDELLDIKLPEGEYDTVGGMIMSMIGRIPQKNEHVSVVVENYKFIVEKVNERRIEKIRIKKLPNEDGADDKDKKD